MLFLGNNTTGKLCKRAWCCKQYKKYTMDEDIDIGIGGDRDRSGDRDRNRDRGLNKVVKFGKSE